MQRILKFWSQPHIGSNLIYIIPITIAIYKGYASCWLLLTTALIGSVIYHSFDHEVKQEWFFLRKGVSKPEFLTGILDYIFSITLIISFTLRFVNSGQTILMIIIFSTLFILGAIFLFGSTYFPFIRKWSTTTNHSVWHIVSGVIAIFIILVT